MVSVATAHHPQIHHGRDQKPQYVGALHRHALMKHPGINQCGQRQEDEAEDEQQKIVTIWGGQVGGEKEQQREHQSRGQQDENQQATGHDLVSYRQVIGRRSATFVSTARRKTDTLVRVEVGNSNDAPSSYLRNRASRDTLLCENAPPNGG